MEQTLKITNVLSDPTRYYIYQHVTKQHSEVTVQDIADQFEIHPNVARLHLSKLEDINLLTSETKKTGKGGRPSRLYRLSEDVVQLNFPFRDYQLLSKIAIQTMMQLGEPGMAVLYETGRIYGKELIESKAGIVPLNSPSSFEDKLHILRNAATAAGFHPVFQPNEDQTQVHFQIFNCPFKEVAASHPETICKMHSAFLKGMFSSVFTDVELIETGNMLAGCQTCTYQANVTK
ncbi:helix-turn-helix domain-containing protein [Bacillus sp. AGMB 02131]|uniref:Helix-turn-helix domain-containing protein n=1 Tax=Peribacillus faecalis TaxID=2772559 RepID=A0A927HC75_9BACI|nr:helix-turn-helix domain-containing protein [Peribacillus faecalis]MBD3108128.1 helix-turn-helix domain-containing protein [Peribacillus faecalis]